MKNLGHYGRIKIVDDMFYDAHIHVGFYSRYRYRRPFYYSPRKIAGVLNRCGVDECIVSSTCAQVRCIRLDQILAEAAEIKRLFGKRAHLFFWLSGHLYDEDTSLSWMQTGLYEGVKFHECETPWFTKRRTLLWRILEKIEAAGLRVKFHSGTCDGCRPRQLQKVVADFPSVKFNLAHCHPVMEMLNVIERYENVWTDVVCRSEDEVIGLRNYNWHDRLMFGSDLPVWQANEDISLTRCYREMKRRFEVSELSKSAEVAFRSFIA